MRTSLPRTDQPGKRVGVIQSNYVPWRGYFDFIASVDVFVIYDDVQYSKNSWRNRNRVKTPAGLRWLTVPVRDRGALTVDQVAIGQPPSDWRAAHRRLLSGALEPAPYFHDALALWEAGVVPADSTLSQLNLRLIHLICDYLEITTPILSSRMFSLTGQKTERLIQLLKQIGATTYVSGPTARGYLDATLFRASGIRLEYKSYSYRPYAQLWGEFVGNVTVLDLIANTGHQARKFLKSTLPNEIVVE